MLKESNNNNHQRKGYVIFEVNFIHLTLQKQSNILIYIQRVNSFIFSKTKCF